MHKSQLHEVGLMFFAHTDSISSGYMTVISHETYLVAFTYSHGCYWEKLSLDLTLDSYKSRSFSGHHEKTDCFKKAKLESEIETELYEIIKTLDTNMVFLDFSWTNT